MPKKEWPVFKAKSGSKSVGHIAEGVFLQKVVEMFGFGVVFNRLPALVFTLRLFP